jgi:hypothetical protein
MHLIEAEAFEIFNEHDRKAIDPVLKRHLQPGEEVGHEGRVVTGFAGIPVHAED